jgi:hypothetical protein
MLTYSLNKGIIKSKGALTMSFDIHEKSAQLLEKLANSLYDRDPANPNHIFFSIKEMHIVDGWIRETLSEYEKQFLCSE